MIEASNIRAGYGDGPDILQDISMTANAREIVTILGPNGCGKSTLLKTVAGFVRPRGGAITINGEGAETVPIHEKVRHYGVGYVPQTDNVFRTMTVTENLQFWARIFGTGTIDAALEAYDLHGLAERPAGSLSAGQKRRLGLARLLVTGRPIWILDEPTVSLDTSAVAMFAGAVRDHLKRGGSALIATHIDLGLDAEVLDLAPFRATLPALDDFDGAFT